MELLQTDPEVGTYPMDIALGARSLGFEAEVRDNLSLDEVREFASTGNPVIALGQVWRSQKDSPASPADEWDSGHYIVVLDVDDHHVYFQDPYMGMCKAFVPRRTFEEHWHQAMGGNLRNPRLVHVAIFIRGEKPEPKAQFGDIDLSTLDFGKLGSISLVVTQFKGTLLPYDFLDELRDIWEANVVRPDAFILLRKDKDGLLSGMEGGRLQDDGDIVEVNALVAAIAAESVSGPHLVRAKAQAAAKAAAEGDFGLSAADLHKVSEKLPADHSAILVLFEDVWERRFKATAEKYGGVVTGRRMISPQQSRSSER